MIYLLVAACILLMSTGQVLLKAGANRSRTALGAYVNPYTIAGYALMLVVTVLTVLALRDIELKAFYALLSLNYVVTALLSGLALKEPLDRNRMAGILIVALGVAVFNA